MAKLKSLDYQLLKQLTQGFGPSGNETEVAEIIRKQVGEAADSIYTDHLGNLIIKKNGSGSKIMIACHMDEVGVIITHIDERGYLYFSPVGGLNSADLISRRVRFKNKQIGVISRERRQAPDDNSFRKTYIDLGVATEEEARSLVSEGDMAVLVGDFHENDSHLISKALDNRISCFIAIEVLKQIKSTNELYFAFTAQEEVGARGAKTAATAIYPDLAIVIDTTISYDNPSEHNRTSLGQGIAIKAMDRSIVVSPKIKNWMAKIASQKGLCYQWEIISTGGTDSGPVHLAHGGIPTGGIAIPVRYLHSGSEIAAKSDIENACLLLTELLQTPYQE